jgi:hypothetical protein
LDLVKNRVYGLPSDSISLGDDERLLEANKIKIQHVKKLPELSLTFERDFGDGWKMDLTFENCERREVSLVNLPRVLNGEGYGIIEDVGGARGLYELPIAVRKKSREMDDEIHECLGASTIYLLPFDIEDANFRLKKLMSVYRAIYEFNWPPTDSMISTLNREYKGKGWRGY